MRGREGGERKGERGEGKRRGGGGEVEMGGEEAPFLFTNIPLL